jgi:predicted nucleic acid-binding protein
MVGNIQADIAIEQLPAVVNHLREVFRTANYLATTAHVIAEFEVVAQQRGPMDTRKFRRFVEFYRPYLARLHEVPIPIQELTTFKGQARTWHLCFTDSALVLAARKLSLPLLTLDAQLHRFAHRIGVRAIHPGWELS